MVAGLITGTLVIEQIFAVPGLGEQFVKSITLMTIQLLWEQQFSIVRIFILSYLNCGLFYTELLILVFV